MTQSQEDLCLNPKLSESQFTHTMRLIIPDSQRNEKLIQSKAPRQNK